MNPLIRCITRYLSLLVLPAFLAFVTGCAGPPEVKKTDDFNEWREKAKTSQGYSPGPRGKVLPDQAAPPQAQPAQEPTPREEGKAREPKKEVKAPEKTLPAQPMTLKMTEEWEIGKLLRFMARIADVSILINENVKGSAKLNVHKAPWDQVFVGILNANGLTYQWEGDIIRIVTLEDREKARRLVEAKTKMLVEEAEYEVKLKTLKAEARRLEPYNTRIVYINYSDAKQIATNLEKLIGVHVEEKPQAEGQPSGKGEQLSRETFKRMPSVAVDTHNNALILHAIEPDIVKMAQLIEQLDRPTPQILIDAHLVQTTKETARELGIKWGGLYHGTNNGKNYYLGPGMGSQDGVSGAGINTPVNPQSGTAANFPAPSLQSQTTGATAAALANPAAFTIGFLSQELGKYILDVELSALEQQRKLKIISSPSISTMDNQKAYIESGREIPYQTVDQYGNINIEWKDAVLKLEVTPHVIEGGVLRMKILTQKDEADFTDATKVQGTPTIIKRKAETTVVILDGQTTVIGGLSEETAENADTGIPGLKEIPLLSWLFKSDAKNKRMDELLIFITPHILKTRDQEIKELGGKK